MTFVSNLNRVLPQKFLGFIPLFIGVEIILGIGILNKAGGVYGILSIFTGHPINFWQWLYNMLSILTLPFYISALLNLKSKPRNARKISLASLIYTVDTLVGLFFTIYFILFWFSVEDVTQSSGDYVKRALDDLTPGSGGIISDKLAGSVSSTSSSDLSSQSASLVRELYVIFSSTIVITVVRIYFNLVIISFTKALLKQDLNDRKYHERLNGDDDDEVEILSATGLLAGVHRFVYNLERGAKDTLNSFFS
ncbi:Inositolphosphorylceramide synthase subunit Kei1-domain-containing protein [Scheffersomyces amazonensis]|uniref:Inositolphosphorylceramide synthase subunit Kei1-domain-containing protein n=1 Tax=Scheffersomyces amazonensis TaxID=1078765 RepID=UPI00315DA285